jgi:hypothetical protein
MCDFLRPEFTDYQFGFLMAVRAPDFDWEEPFVNRLFDSKYENEALAPQIRLLLDNLKAAQEAAIKPESFSIREFDIDWPENEEFLNGYKDGMMEISAAFEILLREVESVTAKGSDSSIFDDVVLPWAEKWQENHKKFNLFDANAALVDEFYENRIVIVSNQVGVSIPSEGPHYGHWFRFHDFANNPAKALVDAVWQFTPLGDGEGIALTVGDRISEPLARERSFCDYEFKSLCDRHWLEASETNNRQLSQRNLLTVPALVNELATSLRLSPNDLARYLGDTWESQPSELGTKLYLRPSRDDVTRSSVEEALFLPPAAGIQIDTFTEVVLVGPVEGHWAGHRLIYSLRDTVKLSLEDPEFLSALDAALWDAQRKHESAKVKCTFCHESKSRYELADEGHCYDCGSEHLGVVY